MPLDRQRLVKCLQQTLSDNDAEALAAIRAANRLMREAGVAWTGLISGSRNAVGGKAPVFARSSHRVPVGEVFETLWQEGYLYGEFRIMRDEWERRKWLDAADYKTLYQKYDEVMGKKEDRDVPEEF